MSKKLIIGAGGQIGVELTAALRKQHGPDNVIATDIKEEHPVLVANGIYKVLNALDKEGIKSHLIEHDIDEVYLLAAMLSATGEKNPERAWEINMNSLIYCLQLAQEFKFKLFWPSSIAVFGPSTPKIMAPQQTIIEPTTIYGISKFAGERLCAWYANKYDLDIRSIRYPGLISYKNPPGGGTTDYAIDIFHQALQDGTYTCFLKKETKLPMMYMPDAIRATLEIMNANKDDVPLNSGYNIAAFSFSPEELSEVIKKEIPHFKVSYAPDYRQDIADQWPESVDDNQARKDWKWNAHYNLELMTKDMIKNLAANYAHS